jgi:hypothetical protein
MIASIYRKLIPSTLRDKIYKLLLGRMMFFVRNFKAYANGFLLNIFGWLLPATEKRKAYAFIGRHGIVSCPGEFMLKYKSVNIEVFRDSDNGMPYVMHHGRKLYFPASYDDQKLITLYRSLIIEQDIESAHRYVTSYDELSGKTLLDIGSAEGIFSLDTIEYTKHVYLFECEEFWIDSLNATFAPWKDKVTIIRKYVGDKSEGNFTTIDDFMKDKSVDDLFLKMDIEGAEKSALKGANQTLKNGKNNRLAVCVYHRDEDPAFISGLMQSHGYKTQFTNGYIYWANRLSKGVVRCQN